MLKKLFFIATLACATLFVFAQDAEVVTEDTVTDAVESEATAEEASIITPFFSIEDTMTLNVGEADGEFTLGSIENEVSDMTFGFEVAVNEMFSLSPYITNTFSFAGDATTFLFSEDNLAVGLAMAISPLDFMSIDLDFAYNTDFFGNATINSGFTAAVGLGFEVEAAKLSFSLADAVNPMFTVSDDTGSVCIDNEFAVDLSFAFFNFFQDKVDSGLYISNALTTDNYADKEEALLVTELEDEFYAGLYVNPLDFMGIKAAFYGDFLTGFDDEGKTIDGMNSTNLGAYFELGLSYKSVGFTVSYNPVFYTDVNGKKQDGTSHTIEACVSFSI